jgi:hypothetical protein
MTVQTESQVNASGVRASDEAEIRKLIEDWARAVRAHDLKGILAHHSADILMFDVPRRSNPRELKLTRRPGIPSSLGLGIQGSLTSPK